VVGGVGGGGGRFSLLPALLYGELKLLNSWVCGALFVPMITSI